jgi:glycerol uptake facilitator-like aquaporin
LVDLQLDCIGQLVLVVVVRAVVVAADLAGRDLLLQELELHAVGTAVRVWLTVLEFTLISTSDIEFHVEEVVADHVLVLYNGTQLATDGPVLATWRAA